MRVLVTGANGFVGSAICRALIGHEEMEPVALIREGSNTDLLPMDIERIYGEFHIGDDIDRILEETKPRAIVHAAAVVSLGRPDVDRSIRINVEGTRTLLKGAEGAGVKRWIQISSMSAHPANRSVYGGSKYQADLVVKESTIPWTILRPSIVYGPQRRGIFHKFAMMMDRLPIVPIVGSGREPCRPVHADDLAGAVIASLLRRASLAQTYQLGGPEEWTFRDLVEHVRQALGKNRLIIPIPVPLCRAGALVCEQFLKAPPLTTDNIEGLNHAQPLDTTSAERDLDFRPRSFEKGFRQCLELGLLSYSLSK